MRYHDITKLDMKNGDGLRVVLWVAGCSHHCPGCQNPITWDPEDGLLFDEAAKQEIFEELERDYVSGITYSGGDPLFCGHREEITTLAREIKEKFPEKTQWLYTGYEWNEICDEEVVSYLDVVIDGKFIEEEKDTQLPWRGSKNQHVINVPKSRETGEMVCRE